MLQKPSECVGCSLYTIGQGFSRPEGTGINRVLLCGEALGYHEAYDGLPFRPRAEAGHVLEMAIQGIGCSRQQFSLFNICACQPLNNLLDGASYEISAINHCKVHFKRVMEQFRPRVIVALGAIPTRTLTGLTGKKLTVEMLQGFPIPAVDYPGVWVIPCYHPSYINRGAWQCLPILMRCLKKAVKLAQLEQYIPEKVNYTTNGTNYELDLMAEELEAKPELVLIGDIETLGKEIDVTLDDEEEDESEDKEAKGITLFQDITQWNFSIKKGEAVAVVNSPDYHPAIRRLWATQNTKAGHNFWFFDLLVMLYNGFKVSGTIHDTMWMFHWQQPDMPGRKGRITDQTDNDKKDAGSLANLQFCASLFDYPWPWKHEFSSNPGWYGCNDASANLLVYYGCKREMEHLGVWQGYIDGVYKMWPILQKMADRGIPVNRVKMMAFVKRLEQMAETVFSRALPLVPKELWPTKQKQGLKKAPKDTDGYVQKIFFIPEEQAERCTCARVLRKEPVPVLGGGFGDNVKQLGEKWYKIKWDCPQCKGTGRLFGEVTRWAFEEEPKIGSPYLLKAYAKYKMHRVPLNKKRKYAMDKEVLDKLIKKYNDPLYQLTREHRELQKMKSTYAVGWMPSEIDERVHPHFGFAPANGQFNSKGPNAQNVTSIEKFAARTAIKEVNLAEEFRDCIEAKPGHVLIAFDWKSMHAQTLAHQAQDWDYLRLAKLDAHSYLTAWIVGLAEKDKALAWDDEKLKAWLKDVKKKYLAVREGEAKPGQHGWGFGMGATTLFSNNPYDPDKRTGFRNVKEAQNVLDALDAAFTVTAGFRRQIPLVAKKQKYLKNLYHAIRWFWCIERWNVDAKKWVHGLDWDKAISFYPQFNAFGYKKFCYTRLEENYQEGSLLDKYGLCNDLHDSLFFHCPQPLADECLEMIKMEMERPSEVLLLPESVHSRFGKGLSIEVEAKMSKTTWREMETIS